MADASPCAQDPRHQLHALFEQHLQLVKAGKFDLTKARAFLTKVWSVADSISEVSEVTVLVADFATAWTESQADNFDTAVRDFRNPIDWNQLLFFIYCCAGSFPCMIRLVEDDVNLGFYCPLRISAPFSFTGKLQAIFWCCSYENHLMSSLEEEERVLTLCDWLERRRPAAAGFFALLTYNKLSGRKVQQGGNESLDSLTQVALVRLAAALLRLGFTGKSKAYLKLIIKDAKTPMPPAVQSRYSFLHAWFLAHEGYIPQALHAAKEAAAHFGDEEEASEVKALIQQLRERLGGVQDVITEDIAPVVPELTQTEMQSAEHLETAKTYMKSKRKRAKRSTSETSYTSTSSNNHQTKQTKYTQPTATSRNVSSERSEEVCKSNISRTPQRPSQKVSACLSFASVCKNSVPGDASQCNTKTGQTEISDQPSPACKSDDSETEDEDGKDVCMLFEQESDSEDDILENTMQCTSILLPFDDENSKTQRSWYNYSLQNTSIQKEKAIFIAKEALDNFEKDFEKCFQYYEPWMNDTEMETMLISNPDQYKRCSLKILSSHFAVAKVLDNQNHGRSEYLIEGRSKIGRTFMDDEVVVELFPDPAPTDENGEVVEQAPSFQKQTNGKVVGVLKQNAFPDVVHPVMFCTVNIKEINLMKPLCKSVPKICILREDVEKRLRKGVSNHIVIYRISDEGFLEKKGNFKINPDKIDQYVFKVVYITWRYGRSRYPLGAVLDVYLTGKDLKGGLELLALRHNMPTLYPQDVLLQVQQLMEEPLPTEGRLDLRNKRIFTVDPQNSKDLDDALSIEEEGTNVVVGVHIADIAALVKPNTPIDNEAKCRAITYYPDGFKPHNMIPEPLSEGKCSLLSGQERLAFSFFYKFDGKGNRLGDVVVKKSVIKSCFQLTYADVQSVLNKDKSISIDKHIIGDIHKLYKITSKLRNDRKNLSGLYVPFEDPRLSDQKHNSDHTEAHALIEELMVMTNTYVAHRLVHRFPQTMLLRCQQSPSAEELAGWLDKEGPVAHLVMQLQNKQITPETRISLSKLFSGYVRQNSICIQSDLWKRLMTSLEQGDFKDAQQIAFMDVVHPFQCLAFFHWIEMMQCAEYKCCHGLNSNERRHFDLGKELYTNITSPIRRYADLHVQRLLHADLDHPDVDHPPSYCTAKDVKQLCLQLTARCKKQREFGRASSALKLASDLANQPLCFRSFVDQLDKERLTLCLPSLFRMSSWKQEITFAAMGISSLPVITTDTVLQQDSALVRIIRKIFHAEGFCHKSLISLWSELDREKRDGGLSSEKRLLLPADMVISRELQTLHLDLNQWAHILKALTQFSSKQRIPLFAPVPKCLTEVEYMSSEKGVRKATGGNKSGKRKGKTSTKNNFEVEDSSVARVCLRPVRYDTTFKSGQILLVQMSAEASGGLLEPQVDLLHISRNFCICTKHIRDPVKTLTRAATVSTRHVQFDSFEKYCRAWLPLVEMEAAIDAGDPGNAIVIEDVQVKMKNATQGCFQLPNKFCTERNISVGGKAPHTIKREESSDIGGYPLDYLCLRYNLKCPTKIVSKINHSKVPEIIDNSYTWLAHASVMGVFHKDKNVISTEKIKDKNRGLNPQPNDKGETGSLLVDFTLSHTSPKVPDELFEKKDGDKMTIEILPKSEVERRAQEMLKRLGKCDLAKAIAFGDTLPALDEEHLEYGQQEENYEVDSPFLCRNNRNQKTAIRAALTNSLTLIQGPPGTGKTYTGIKIIYHFARMNQMLQDKGVKRTTILFCGPSNKAVDLVAVALKEKLGDKLCPKFVRVYSSTIESKDYSTPGSGDIKHKRGIQELNSEPALMEENLNHLIRDPDTETGKEILAYEKVFRENPEMRISVETQKKYRKLVFEASVAEIRKYQMVMTTCAVAGNQLLTKALEGRVYQVMIDECGMSQEPQSMIPIIAAKAQQVVLIGDHKQLRPVILCQQAADLGLDQSLFERLVTKFPDNRVFLNMQYRMHPAICEFPSVEFYNGRLRTGFSPCWHPVRYFKKRTRNVVMEPLPFWQACPINHTLWDIPQADHRVLHVLPIVLVDVRGDEEFLTVATEDGNENSRFNKMEADKVIEILTYLKTEHKESEKKLQALEVLDSSNDDANCDVALLTQYRAQKNLLKDRVHALCHRGHSVFTRYDKTNIKVSTVVSSQGGEWDYVILSLVRSLPSFKIEPNPTDGWCRQNLGFITDKNQANVALTRAKRGLIIVGNVELLKCDKSWCRLVDRYNELGCLFTADQFPPPPETSPRSRHRRTKHSAAQDDWKEV